MFENMIDLMFEDKYEVYVFDTTTGQVVMRIRAGGGAHGLSYFPQPGRYSIGHNGVYR